MAGFNPEPIGPIYSLGDRGKLNSDGTVSVGGKRRPLGEGESFSDAAPNGERFRYFWQDGIWFRRVEFTEERTTVSDDGVTYERVGVEYTQYAETRSSTPYSQYSSAVAAIVVTSKPLLPVWPEWKLSEIAAIAICSATVICILISALS